MTLLGRWGPDNFIGLTGAPVPGLAVEIRLPGTTTKANLFTTSAGTVAAANPVIADDIGNASFYAAAGLYDFFANGRTISSVPVLPHPTELAVLLSEKSTFNVRSSLYGAKGDGVTNDAPAIQAAINAAQAAGGGIVYLPPGTYLINSEIAFVPNGNVSVDLQGAGMRATTIKLGASGARVKFSAGGGGTTAGQYGSESGNFSINGNGVGTNGLFVGLGSNRSFANINVEGCTGDGVRLEQLQNSKFDNLNVLRCGTGIRFDYGVQACEFDLLNVVDCGTGVVFAASGKPNLWNEFVGGLVEWQGQAGAVTYVRLVDVLSGAQNQFVGTQISAAGNPTLATTADLIRTSSAGYELILNYCTLQGGVVSGTARGIGINGTTASLDNAIVTGTKFLNLDCRWKLADTSTVVRIGPSPSINVTQSFRNQSEGTAAEGDLVRCIIDHPLYFAGTVSGSTILRSNRTGDTSAPRIQIFDDGTINWGSGNAPQDVALYRAGARRLHTDMQFEAEALSSVLVSGVPTDASFGSAPRDGTMVVSNNNKIYVRIGGAWKSVTVA